MNRMIAAAAVIIAFLLLAPYVGINLFGGTVTEPVVREKTPLPVAKVEPSAVPEAAPKRKQTMVEDVLQPKAPGDDSTRKLSDIEQMLKRDGQDK